ncbi:MAG TPA: tRNA dihydrouridine synthase DusB [Steroidobacteraceae bacterium]|nr:tRNA dihydrouridine synthase DusB [Steroidobacteraceae bacterium]
MSFSIGPWRIDASTVLAPMAGVTDRPFRILCRRFGAGLAASEMITADQRLWHTTKTRQRMNHEGEPEPRVVQLAGNDPQQLADAARANVDMGAQIIDINMGCPAKKVYGKLCGSALLGDEPLVARILEAVVRAVTVPVTVKIRTGIDRAHVNAGQISRIAAESGIRAIAVHGRTRADFYEGEAEYDTIRGICAEARIPVIANGDIDSAKKACSVLDFTRASAVMIGRAAHGSPWIFRDVNSFLETGKNSAPLLRAEIRDIILEHVTALYAFHGEAAGVRIARKHLGWYCQQHTDTQGFRPQLMAAESSSVQFATAAACFGAWVDKWSDKENKSPGQERANAGNESEERQSAGGAQAEHHGHA